MPKVSFRQRAAVVTHYAWEALAEIWPFLAYLAVAVLLLCGLFALAWVA